MWAHDLSFAADGAQYFPASIAPAHISTLIKRFDQRLQQKPGKRLFGEDWGGLLDAVGPVGRVVASLIGPAGKPVRIIAFDKTASTNWSLGWHQDRTIAVRERAEVEGFGPWATKDGIVHVAPPMALLSRMVTLRLHLDDCDENNAPLKIALGSHRLGAVPADKASEEASARQVYVCTAHAGDIWAYSTPILHASDRSKTAGHRRVLQVDYSIDDLPAGLEWLGI